MPFRNYLMDATNYAHCDSLILQKLGELARKIWNPTNYKSQVSPHELVQVRSPSHNVRWPARASRLAVARSADRLTARRYAGLLADLGKAVQAGPALRRRGLHGLAAEHPRPGPVRLSPLATPQPSSLCCLQAAC